MSTCRNSKNCPSGYECKDNIFGLKEGRCSPKRVRSKKVKSKRKSKPKPKKVKSKRKSKPKPKKKSKKVKSKRKPKKSISDLEFHQETDPDTVMFSNAWWHYFRENWWKILLKFMLILIVFFAIYGAVVPLINFQPWFSWWKTYGGNKLQTSNCFSMTSLAYAKGFKLYYYIGSLFGGVQQGINLPSLLILGRLMDNFAIGMQAGGGRYMTPKSLCESIVPDEHIYSFNRQEIVNCIGSLTGGNHAWPSGTDLGTWKTIIQFWGGAGLCPNGSTQPTSGSCKGVDPKKKESTYCAKRGKFIQNEHGNQTQWYSTGSKYIAKGGGFTNDPSQAASAGPGQGDKKKLNTHYAGNFLWEIYGMPYDSLAIRAFLSESANDWNGNPLYLSLLPAALGARAGTVQAGGWFGVLQESSKGAGTGISESEFWRVFWAIDEPENLPAPGGTSTKKKCNSSNTVQAVTTGISTMIGIAILSVMTAGSATPFIIAGALAGGVAATGSLASSGCL